MNRTDKNLNFLVGGTAFVGVLSGSAAHAQYVVYNPNISVTAPGSFYFNVDDGATSTTYTELEFQVSTAFSASNSKAYANLGGELSRAR